jgi:hypothetical protein
LGGMSCKSLAQLTASNLLRESVNTVCACLLLVIK